MHNFSRGIYVENILYLVGVKRKISQHRHVLISKINSSHTGTGVENDILYGYI